MAKRYSTEHFIDKVTEVADARHTATFAAPAQGRRPQPFDPNTQSLLLLGLPGCGCGPLATALSERLQMRVTHLERSEDVSPEATIQKAMQAMAQANHVFILDDRLAPLLDAQALSLLPVVPVYVIATVGLCLERMGAQGLSGGALGELRVELAARQDALEPAAMSLARHILRGEEGPAHQLCQLLDKLGVEQDEDGLDLPF